ncbi:drebrin isoform X2 [Perognathus longimembris pacificus]|uniref:drebrin isoform X2 n=1 Tax=Perognathus longimembris pacificus TaxID=214514 RepID=UPI0020187059|nr:drebrin isoform X2 [Perognathus longimembris pacificus]
MAGVSFSGHRLELLAAYEEVIREESAADWALYTYEDGSDDLKLAASGGGLQELSGHFENQKVMYGFCSVKDSKAALPKYVLINWVGEDVPDARKCACASHVAKVAEFFQGVDVIVNASSVEDIDAGAIGQRLSNGLARLSSPVLHRLRLREDENAEPVGTTYQKTDAAVEMKRINREQFWEQAKKEEELRKEEERKKALDARLRFEQERMEQERQEQEERERRYREREQQIEEHRRKQQTLEAEEAKRRLKEQSIFGDQRDEEEEETQMKKSESEVEEAAAIIAQRPDNPREFFKQQERVASASGSSCDAPTPFNHRPGSHLDSHRRMAPTPIPTRSPSDSSTASTPVTEQIERALDEVTSSQPPPLPPPPPPAQVTDTQEPSPSLDHEETSKEARAAAAAAATAPQAWAGPVEEPPQAQEPPPGQGSPLEDLMFSESPEPAVLAAPEEPVPADTTAADTYTADTIETDTATTVANNITPVTTSLIDLWPGNGEEASAPQAEPRAPTPPSGAKVTLAEVPLLDEVAQEPLPPANEGCANLLNFDELPEPPATFCDPEEEVEGEPLAAPQTPALPSSLEEVVDQEAEQEEQELETEPHLLTNGETTQKEGTQQASEGYFSQSQEEEFAQSEELCAKAPPPVFYNKPPEIDITCWDADPVQEEEEGFEGGD